MKTITSKKAVRLLPGLLPDDNKYTRGLCELVVGDPIYAGAGVLAVMAATRMGAGYVRAYTSFETAAALRVVQPSCVCQPVDTFVEHRHAACEGRPCAVVVGSGFAVSDAAKATVLDVLRLTQAPVLVDGGGLATLATDEGASALRERFVLRLLPRIGARPTAFLQRSILKKSRHRALVAKRKASRRRRLTHCLLQGPLA